MSDEPNDREDFDISRHVQDRDMDNNGIPDFQQNHLNGSPDNPYYGPGAEARNDASRGYQSYDDSGSSTSGPSSNDENRSKESDRTDRMDYGPDAASDSPYSRTTREAMGHAGSTYSSAKPDQGERAERNGTADRANDSMRDKERKSEANVNRALDDDKYRQALNDLEVRRLRGKPRKETRLSEEVRSASNHHRTDDKDGMALGKAMLGGLKGGLKYERERAKEKKTDRDNKNADKVMLEFIVGEAEKRRDEIADRRIEEERKRQEADGKAKAQADRSPTGEGPDGSGPQSPGPDSPGPGGNGPGGDGPGGGSGGKPADSDRTEAPGVGPKGPEAPAPEAPKPANENETVEPLRETGADRAAERASVLHGERERGFGREPGQGAESAVEVSVAKEKAEAKKPEVDPKSAARDAASPVSSNVSPGEANASAGAGMIMAAVNPPLGIAATAAKSRHAQVEAGAEHVDLRKAAPDRNMPQSKGPEASRISVSVPGRSRDAGAVPRAPTRSQGERRLETTSSSNVVDFRRPQRADRPGGIRAQAGNLPPSRRPDVSSRGEEVTQPRTRIMGVGSALGRFIEQDVRGPGGKGQGRGDDAIAASMAGRGKGR